MLKIVLGAESENNRHLLPELLTSYPLHILSSSSTFSLQTNFRWYDSISVSVSSLFVRVCLILTYFAADSYIGMPRQPKPFTQVGAPAEGQPQSRLFTLPPELRNMVYEWVLHRAEIGITSRTRKNTRGRSASTALLLTCKQVHIEAIQLYYHASRFHLGYGAYYRVKEWLRSIGAARASLIRTLCVSPTLDLEVEIERGHESLNARAAAACALLCEIQQKCTLAPGVLKAEVGLSNVRAWTAEPEAFAEELTKVATPIEEDSNWWAWTAQPSGKLRKLRPFVKAL